jgi:hypothetical protein
MFQWAPPDGVTIRQHFSPAPSDPFHPKWKVEFSAVCRCGTEGPVRAARSDALDDLEVLGHPCQASTAAPSLFDFPCSTTDVETGGLL